MSAALPYLQKLRKSQLTDWAEATDLHDYEEYNKPELATLLDQHLQANQSIFAKDARLTDYYRRLSQTPRKGSPVKRDPRVEISPPVKETPRSAPRSARRRQMRVLEEEVKEEETKEEPKEEPKAEPKEEAEQPQEESDASPPPVFQTPGPSPLNFQSALPASPALIADAVDRESVAWRKKASDWWAGSGVPDGTQSLRSLLSSVKAVQILTLLLEGCSIIYEVLPLRFVSTITIWAIEISIKVPDVFVLVDGVFWAPFSLWLLTSILLPLTVAYFFNISLNLAPGSAASHARRSRASPANFDPLSFNIAKAGLAYLVYARQFNFFNLYSQFSIARVNAAVPGQWAGLVTGSAIGVIGTLYEAILRK
ncbi:hypothetical protein BDV32DRAFT_114943 [Aspergillus pseudonomiae]|uniref:Uncharacterized protein n=1 Tax=Aspergillus pseudonomiae TaxID=1506151 RepID=A0A5N6IHU3_9EURO|nr:uncharacterized protein BDV37DRAFT_237516 [Aspergillus pseudonomiae]KAB8266028.1 hypothetical protein BDV32DRAFT_114943 [Aspergillus pseudonomiae]KAE8408894.1 hypothetical protein BDV37DRAFT_237516 [Aspergillus pseudonomiae]